MPELTCKIRIMNFDRACRVNAKKGILTANHANSKASRIRSSGIVCVFGVFRGYKFNLISMDEGTGTVEVTSAAPNPECGSPESIRGSGYGQTGSEWVKPIRGWRGVPSSQSAMKSLTVIARRSQSQRSSLGSTGAAAESYGAPRSLTPP